MKRFLITYIEKNTYAAGLEQSIHWTADSSEEAKKQFQTQEMGICEKVISVVEE